jgi:cob(I)alamin adenosyltransferase
VEVNSIICKREYKFDSNLTALLEENINSYEKEIPLLTGFILPRGDISITELHICRSLCRNVERNIVDLYLKEDLESEFNEIQNYFNRLSDFLFVFSRYYSYNENIKEIEV